VFNFKQQPITVVEREQQSGHAAPKQPATVQDWAGMIDRCAGERSTSSIARSVERAHWSNAHNIYATNKRIKHITFQFRKEQLS